MKRMGCIVQGDGLRGSLGRHTIGLWKNDNETLIHAIVMAMRIEVEEVCGISHDSCTQEGNKEEFERLLLKERNGV